jgi:hypothetical protein
MAETLKCIFEKFFHLRSDYKHVYCVFYEKSF